MLRGNETWTEKDKHLINVKTTRNNVGKLIKYKILILQSIRLIDSDWLIAIMQTSGLMLLSFVPRGRVSGFIVCGVYVGGGRREIRFDRNPRYMVAARNVKRSISMNLRTNKWLWTESKNEEMQLSENEALWLAKKKTKNNNNNNKKWKCLRTNQVPQSLLATLRLHVRLGSGVVPIELHCGDVLMTNFDPVNFCPFDTFLRNTLVQINSKLNSKSHDNSTYTNTVFWQKSLHYRLRYKQKKHFSLQIPPFSTAAVSR